jgi:Uma2 family endonuclease
VVTANTQISESEYFKMHFEDLEPEFVLGELIERPMPTLIHGWLQVLLSIRLRVAGFPVVAVRMRLATGVIRIPDVALFVGSLPTEQVPTHPPFVVIEITSPDDRYREILRKLEDYRIWGVQHIWVIQPELRKFHIYESGTLREVGQFELTDSNIQIDANELFAEATAP